MNEDLQLEVEIVELGDAKEETKGVASGTKLEDNPFLIYQRIV